MENIFKDKTILVTGTGTVGTEIARQLLPFKPYSIRLFDNSEESLWKAKLQFKDRSRLRFLLGDIKDYDRVDMATWSCDYVFHTAAQKHVMFGNYNPLHSIDTNIIGAENIIKACLKNPTIKKVCNTSTDKVVYPYNFYAKTKAIAEYLFSWASRVSLERQTFFNVRFCNVINSTGSVLQTWEQQIKEGFITITDMDMKRYMIEKEVIAKFIIDTMRFAEPFNIYIPKKGIELHQIKDLALQFIQSHGYKSLDDIEVRIIGKFPGEKLGEELWSSEEKERIVDKGDYWVIQEE